MEMYKTISFKFNVRTKRYTIGMKNNVLLFKGIAKILNNSSANALFVKRNNTSFEIVEFFMLELEFLLNTLIKKEHSEIILPILKECVDLLDFVREKTWVSVRYNEVERPLDLNKITKLMKYPPMKHQIPIFEKYNYTKAMANLSGFLMDAGAGAGKTFSSLALGEALDYDHFLIIAPRQVIEEVWVKSVKETLYKRPQTYVVLDSKTKYNGEKFAIMHFEYLEKAINNDKFLRQLRIYKPMTIIDEVHNFNNIKSKRTEALLKLKKTVTFKDIALLTGTPIKYTVDELIPLFLILDKKFIKAFDIFKIIYKNSGNEIMSDMINYRFGLYRERVEKPTDVLPKIKIEDYKLKIDDGDYYTLEAIKDRVNKYKKERLEYINKHMVTYKENFYAYMSEAKSNLYGDGHNKKMIEAENQSYLENINKIRKAADKNKLYEVVNESMEAKAYERDVILKNIKDKDGFKDLIAIMKYPKFKVMGEALGKIILGSRIECYSKLAEKADYKMLSKTTDKKLLIFSNYINTCKIAYEKSKEMKMQPITVFGDTTADISGTVNTFTKVKEINPLIATYKSLSTGVPVTAANVVLCLDLPFRMYIFDQAVSRVHRIGQDKDVVIFMAKLDTGNMPNITERDLVILNTSQDRVEFITRNEFPYEMPRQEFFDEDEEVDEMAEEVIYENAVSFVKDKNFNFKNIVKNIRDIIKIKK